jgi:hypothetical protein
LNAFVRDAAATNSRGNYGIDRRLLRRAILTQPIEVGRDAPLASVEVDSVLSAFCNSPGRTKTNGANFRAASITGKPT